MADPQQLAGHPEHEPRIRTPREHGELLHAGGKGTIAVSKKRPDRPLYPWDERNYPVEVAIDLLDHYQGRDDVYLSTQRFRGRRRVAQLLSLSSLHADLDYYKVPELKGTSPGRVLEGTLGALERARKPEPSLAIFSGRGLYLMWLHSPIPRAALPRWEACQRELREVLRPFGADGQALDAARVLRVVGTRHGGTGASVEALTRPGEAMPFDELARVILPAGRGELRDIRVQRALRRPRKAQERLWGAPEGYNAATLWEARLGDLQRLRELRWFGEPMPDFRDRWMFVAGVAMSWLAIPSVLRRELYALSREVGGWTEATSRSKLHAVFRTAHEAARGEKVEWAGMKVDPRYRLKNKTIIEALEISPEEEREMRTIIGDDERRRRDRERKNPEMSRQEYLVRAAKRRTRARRLSEDGMSLRKIAEELGISKSQVQRVLNED
ncbi:MAG: helix-turn-helix domain-containing protein [Actinomycetota bacterium]|nr:helix-turn-helix domain-containing protein [Actinomycetota bacterium]